MKKSFMFLGLVVFILTVFSCDNITSESKKKVVNDPAKDVVLIIESQEEFGKLAQEIAAKGVINDKDMERLEKAYLKFFNIIERYAKDTEGQHAVEELITGEELRTRANNAEDMFYEGIYELSNCEGYQEFENRMREIYEKSSASDDDFI